MAGIDRDYWLEFAKEGISKSIESREKAADKLDVFLAYVWTTYTSVFALASFLNLISSNILQLVFISQPILIIMLARYFCTIVSMPSTSDDDNMRADPNDVASIIDSYIVIVEDKRKKLRKAKIMSFISILSLILALIGYNLFNMNKGIEQELKTMKLKQELNDVKSKLEKPQQNVNDSIKLINDYVELKIQNTIKTKKLQCLETDNYKRLDSLKWFDK